MISSCRETDPASAVLHDCRVTQIHSADETHMLDLEEQNKSLNGPQ